MRNFLTGFLTLALVLGSLVAGLAYADKTVVYLKSGAAVSSMRLDRNGSAVSATICASVALQSGGTEERCRTVQLAGANLTSATAALDGFALTAYTTAEGL